MADRPWASQGGKVIGTIELKADMPQTSTELSVALPALKELTGKHALYFVFASETKEKSLCILEDFVFRMVSEMKPPCDKLLKAQYWDKLSGAEIAEKYGYSGPDSVKTQKSKCIKKLRPLIEKFIKL